MDILDTHAYDRRQKRNTVLFFSWKRQKESLCWPTFLMCPFVSSLPSATVVRLVFFSPAVLFGLSTVPLPVDPWFLSIHHLSRRQVSTRAAPGCCGAELERGPERPGCGGRTGVLRCGWLLPGLARAFSARYVAWYRVLLIRSIFFPS